MSNDKTSALRVYSSKRPIKHPLPHHKAVRQGGIVTLAFHALGKEAAIAFLNTENAKLGGRPIALATESASGMHQVEKELERLYCRRTTRK
ncbi:antitoxin Xre/MbcA/ParS toxin-binding domain-containing protein [Tsuneonella mangrovi]|uniref:antitoxin Xre/MbcA/ParS toxin-binding domain-containing protein n=1 Tax=Tsuneonella mangrovi TaxID=1982042 RepID=UPI000BA26566|nr:antitoxin Xre/MbcA/ParS toxin-binding domain-containing protein [Tsuneonella mangrovi]